MHLNRVFFFFSQYSAIFHRENPFFSSENQFSTLIFRGFADKFPMGTKSFDQILTEKIIKNLGKNPFLAIENDLKNQISPRDSQLDPAHLAFLIGKIPQSQYHLKFQNYVKPQPTAQTKTTAETKVEIKETVHEAILEIPRKKHSFNPKQLKAVEYFKLLGWSLRVDFIEPELKSAYRDLARKLHPDRKSGSHTSFIQLKNQYDLLIDLVTECF